MTTCSRVSDSIAASSGSEPVQRTYVPTNELLPASRTESIDNLYLCEEQRTACHPSSDTHNLLAVVAREDVSWASSPGRRRNMQAIRSRDTRPELAVRRRLHSDGLRYRVAIAP